jgi:hypothetical protein
MDAADVRLGELKRGVGLDARQPVLDATLTVSVKTLSVERRT